MKKRKILLTSTIGLITTPLFLIACGENRNQSHEWDTDFTIQLSTSWFKSKIQGTELTVQDIAKNLKTEFDRLKNLDPEVKNLANVKFTIKEIDDTSKRVGDIIERSDDFTIANFTTVIESLKNNNGLLDIRLQTTTNAFKFDLNSSDSYIDGTENDPLRKIAKKTNELFSEQKFNDWSDKEAEKPNWNGTIFKYFYQPESKDSQYFQQVDFYRGVIWISGTLEERTKIKEAWDNKDWNAFRNFGILHGKTSSGGKWKLQQTILKNHFSKPENTFTTLEQDKLSHEDKYKKPEGDPALNLGQIPNFHIAFDDEGSFAWTHNKKDGKRFNPPENQKMEVLIATSKLNYDLGVFRTNMHPKQVELITQAFINLSNDKKDIYGPRVGYNGFKKADNFEKLESIYKKAYEIN